MTGISYPLQIAQINNFEEQNDVSVNVIGFDDGDFFPIYVSKHNDKTHEVDLLYITEKNNVHHCYIKNLNKLLSRTKTNGHQHKFCRNCFQGFTSQKVLDKHLTYCSKHDAHHLKFPTKGDGDIIEFDDFQKQMRVPFVIYADFETFARKVDTCVPNPSKSNTNTVINYKTSGFGYQVVCSDQRFTKQPVIYRGPEASKHLIEKLFEEEQYIKGILDRIEPLHMTPEDEDTFETATHCFICCNVFNSTSGKVRDHCHISGKFRGAACSNCNLNFQHPSHIPVIFHNLRGFDSHLIMQSVGLFKHKRINVIPNNIEKYVSFSLGSLRFLDSFQFLLNSLAGLVDDLVNENPDHFRLLKKEFPDNEQRSLLLRKCVYPYTWVDSESKFDVNHLPAKEDFYDNLSKSHISDDDYEHARLVWDTFNLDSMGQYHDLYLKSDVLQLGCIFERFRDECMFNYGLDPAHFYTSPGLAWSAALKISICRLHLITDPDKYLFVVAGMREGISQISNRLATANNKYIPDTHDPSKESSYLIYQDCNNLYGHAMCMSLPTSDFKFLTDEEFSNFNIMDIQADADKGYMLEVDLEYPHELHDLHSDYPLAPETKIIADDMLSPYSKKLWRRLNPSLRSTNKAKSRVKTSKLLTTLEHKSNYVCHYRNLQLYLKLGMKLKKVHRILEFTQLPFLKEYIELNTRRRQAAKGEFQKSFSCVFGKTMENLRDRVNIHLIHTKKKLLKQVAKSSFERCQIFNKDLVAVQLKKTMLTLNKPIGVGMSILELSKCVMYDHHYNYIMNKYGHTRAKLMMTDTDSLFYHIKTEDIYADMAEDKHLFDFSNYKKNHPLYDESNAKTPGLFRDETGGIPIAQMAGLRSKMYSMKYAGKEVKQAKGIVKSVANRLLKTNCDISSM